MGAVLSCFRRRDYSSSATASQAAHMTNVSGDVHLFVNESPVFVGPATETAIHYNRPACGSKEADVDSEPSMLSCLKNCQQQVNQHYKDTTSTFSAHPLDPSVTVGTDECFIHLNLNKENDRIQPLKTWEDLFNSEVVGSVNVLLSGGAGAGKSTLLVKVANSCIAPGPKSPLAKFKLVFLLMLRQMSKTSCVVAAIFDQILPKDTNLTKTQLEKIVKEYETEIAFLLDGLDEIPSAVLESQEGKYTVKDILYKRTLVKCSVVVTTRPHMIDYVLRVYPNYARVETKGFTPENRDRYIESYFQDDSSKGKSLISNLEKRESLQTLALTPIITQMLCILWKHKGSLPEKTTDLYTDFLQVLVSRRSGTGQVPSHMVRSILDGLGHIALDGMLGAQGERLIFPAEEIDQATLMQGSHVGFLQVENFREGLEVKRLVTFSHKSFQEFCAARHLSGLAENKSDFHMQLRKINSSNVDEFENLLRFCCGTSVKAAGLILEHINQLGNQERLARLLLFESGSKTLVNKLDLPTRVNCKNQEDLIALCNYLQHVQQPLKETTIWIPCYSIVDLRLLREILQCTNSVGSIWVLHYMSAQGKEELQVLEETFESVGGRYRDRLELTVYIYPASRFDAEYVARSLTCLSQIQNLDLYLVGRSPSDVLAMTKFMTGCALRYLVVNDINLHSHVTCLAPVVSSIRRLELVACGLEDDDVKDVISILPAGHGLRDLDVSFNSFSSAAVDALTRHLSGLPQLRALTLTNIGSDPIIVKEVVDKNLPNMKGTDRFHTF